VPLRRDLIDGSLTPLNSRDPAVTLGHETAGVIEAVGPERTGCVLGQQAAAGVGNSYRLDCTVFISVSLRQN
jgi:D-arabinose 1-dehydrogenase-like Zn-dependent alcohol dehydrogenase